MVAAGEGEVFPDPRTVRAPASPLPLAAARLKASGMSDATHHLHLVSDATGETIAAVARACLVQFDGIEPIEHVWSLIRTAGQVERVLAGIKAHPGPVLYTVVNDELRGLLVEGCRQQGVPSIPVLDPIIRTLASIFQARIKGRPGLQHELDDDYYRRIDAVHFALGHDDGQATERLEDADVIIVGVSRTSKTPTCMYLANRGVKAANVPLVPGVTLPDAVMNAQRPLVVGLTKDPNSLVEVRRTRLRHIGEGERETDYVDPELVKAEVLAARRLFNQQGWPMIDVSRRSIEETAAAILTLLQERGAVAAP